MKKLVLSALIALSSLSGTKAANLYSSNLGNGFSLPEATTGIASGTVRFGIFPDDFDIEFNSGDFAALDAAFVEVASFSGDLDFNDVDGFYSKGASLTYSNSGDVDGVDYATGIAGKKIYIWVLDNVTPASATQQIIASSDQTWPAADAVITDAFASTDTGVAGLTFYVGGLSQGENIGAGVASHILTGTQTEVTEVALTTPNETVNVGTQVVLTATADGSPPKTYAWYKNGVLIAGQSSRTLTFASATAQDSGVYTVTATNGITATPVTSNALSLTVNSIKPTILTQPMGTVVAEGGTLNLETYAVGQGTLLYQWKKGANITGQTSPELTLPNMSLAQAGSYSVTVTNVPLSGGGAVNSAKAEVVVVSQAENTIVAAEGAKALLSAVVAGKGASYQWFKNGSITPLANGSDYTGVTTTKLSVLAVTGADSGEYYCQVTVGETSVNSGMQTLNVFTAAPELDDTQLLLMPDAQIGVTYSYQIPVLGGASQAPVSYAAKGLPTGLKLNTKTGLITGRPTKTTTSDATITFTVTNKVGKDTATASIAVLGSPELAGLAGSYVGPIERNVESGLPGAQLGGRFELTVSTLGALTGKLYLGADILPVKGFIEYGEEFSTAELVIARKGGLTPLFVEFEIEGDLLVNGVISDSVNEVNFDGYKNIHSKTNPADDYRGQYNFAIGFTDEENENVGDASVPQGAGYGIFTVAADGKLSIKGKTADGEAYTTSSFVGPEGEVFLFQTLYKTVIKGSIHGRMTIDTAEDNMITGTATQLRPADPSTKQRTYAAGFDITDFINNPDDFFNIVGGMYVPSTSVLLGKEAGDTVELTFEGGADADGADATITLLDKNKLTVGANTAKTKLVVNAKTGLITGSFTLADKRAGKFEGVVIPYEGDLLGLGYYLLPTTTDKTSPILSGMMSLEELEAPPPPPCNF